MTRDRDRRGPTDHPPLFTLEPPRLPRGRVRRGLDADVAAAAAGGHVLAAAGVASLRTLADQIDALERGLRTPEARPYDRVPLATLAHEFGETYDRVFAAVAVAADPIAAALDRFLEAETGNPQNTGAD